MINSTTHDDHHAAHAAPDEHRSKAAKALDACLPPLALALERLDLNLSSLDAATLTAAMKMLNDADGSKWDCTASDLIQTELEKHLARHLAKTADSFDPNVRQDDNGSWYVDLWATGEKVQRRTFKTMAEARAAGDVLCDFLRLSVECEYSYQVPPGPAHLRDDFNDEPPF